MKRSLLLIVSVLFALVPFCLGSYQIYNSSASFESAIGSPFDLETIDDLTNTFNTDVMNSQNGFSFTLSDITRSGSLSSVSFCTSGDSNSNIVTTFMHNSIEFLSVDLSGSPTPVYAVGGNIFNSDNSCIFASGIAVTIGINPESPTQQNFSFTPPSVYTFWGIYTDFPITLVSIQGPSTDSNHRISIDNLIVGGPPIPSTPPVANPDSYTFYVNSVDNLITPLSNDVAANVSTLVLQISQPSTGGNVTQNGDGYYFTPTSNFVGTVFFTYNITDSNGLSSNSNITITVESPKIPAYCYNLTTITVSKALQGSPQYFTFQDFGCDLSFWSIASVNTTELYSFQSPNKVKLSIQPSMSGVRPVHYQVVASVNNTQFVHNVITKINIVNHNPVINNANFTWTYPRTQQIFPTWNLLTNCTDQDGDNVTVVQIQRNRARTNISVVQLDDFTLHFVPEKAVVSVSPTGEISLTAPSNSNPVTAGSPLALFWKQCISFQFQITDGDVTKQYAWGVASINSINSV